MVEADACFLSFAGLSWTEGGDGKKKYVFVTWFDMMLTLSSKRAHKQGSDLNSANALAVSLIL